MPERKKVKYRRIVKSAKAKVFKTNWQEQDFFKHCEIDSDLVEKSKITWEELSVIHDNHYAKIKQLNTVASYIADRLREIPQIHSVRVRVKDPRHLIKKILRKRIEDASRDIRFENYQQEVTDLIGIRALHLYKGDWLGIHNFIKEEWDTAETPIAYIREGDNPELTKEYEKNGCEVKLHPRKYRSIHYSK